MNEDVLILTKKERLKKIKKIDDKVAIELYKEGLSDEKIAKRFNMGRGTVYAWRMKRGLVANHPRPHGGENLDSNELKNSFKRNLKKIKECFRKRVKEGRYKEYYKEYLKLPRSKEYQKEYNREYKKRPSVKKKTIEYDNRSRTKEIRRKYSKQYCQRDYVKEYDKQRKKVGGTKINMKCAKIIIQQQREESSELAQSKSRVTN